MQAKAGGEFPPEAFQFVRDGLSHTVGMIHGQHGEEMASDEMAADESRHVDGQQLCLGLRDYAVDRYGKLAKAVLGKWGIRETADFGRIVFAMIEVGLMRKTDDDSLDDFVDVFDFAEAFDTLQPS